MSLPFEKTNAVLQARQMLLDIMDPKQSPGIPKEVRQRARSVLKHFPSKIDLEIACEKVPEVFGKDWQSAIKPQEK